MKPGMAFTVSGARRWNRWVIIFHSNNKVGYITQDLHFFQKANLSRFWIDWKKHIIPINDISVTTEEQ